MTEAMLRLLLLEVLLEACKAPLGASVFLGLSERSGVSKISFRLWWS